jgi:hypothetical protein
MAVPKPESPEVLQAMTTALPKDALVQAATDQVSSVLGEEAVILNLQEGKYFGLNPVGTRVWQLIQTPRTVEAILAGLLEEYDVTPEQCERDLMDLLSRLADAGLIEVQRAGAA